MKSEIKLVERGRLRLFGLEAGSDPMVLFSNTTKLRFLLYLGEVEKHGLFGQENAREK